MSKKIAELQEQVEKATPEVKAKLEETLKGLQEHQASLKKYLEDAKEAAGQAWMDLKAKLDDTMKKMDEDLEKGKSN